MVLIIVTNFHQNKTHSEICHIIEENGLWMSFHVDFIFSEKVLSRFNPQNQIFYLLYTFIFLSWKF